MGVNEDAAGAAPQRLAIVVLVEGPDKKRETRVYASARVRIGREGRCDIVVDDPKASKEHAEIVAVEDGWTLRDLGSSNGSFVNGARVTEKALAKGDRIRVGRTEIVFLGAKALASAPRRKPVEKTAPSAPPPASPSPVSATPAARHLKPLVIALIAAVVVLSIVVVALLVMVLRNGERNGGEKAPTSAAPALPVVALPDLGPARNVPASRAEDEILAAFAREVEGPLLNRCGSCHDGLRGGRLLLVSGFSGKVGAMINLGALMPFLEGSSIKESRFFQKAGGTIPHTGGQALNAQETERMAAFLCECVAAFPGGKGLWQPAPARLAVANDVELEKEISLRRVFLDLVGRPPTSRELGIYGTVPLGDLVATLVKSPEYDVYWNNDTMGALKWVWKDTPNEALSHAGTAARLGEHYATRMAGRPKIGKSARQLVASLFVDLRDAVPAEEDLKILREAFEACGGDLLPLAVALTGTWADVAAVPIERIYARFSFRVPVQDEKDMAEKMRAATNGVRVLVVGLASSGEYRVY